MRILSKPVLRKEINRLRPLRRFQSFYRSVDKKCSKMILFPANFPSPDSRTLTPSLASPTQKLEPLEKPDPIEKSDFFCSTRLSRKVFRTFSL